jgi:hypothetical protein
LGHTVCGGGVVAGIVIYYITSLNLKETLKEGYQSAFIVFQLATGD